MFTVRTMCLQSRNRLMRYDGQLHGIDVKYKVKYHYIWKQVLNDELLIQLVRSSENTAHHQGQERT